MCIYILIQTLRIYLIWYLGHDKYMGWTMRRLVIKWYTQPSLHNYWSIIKCCHGESGVDSSIQTHFLKILSKLYIPIFRPFLLLDALWWCALCRVLSHCALCHILSCCTLCHMPCVVCSVKCSPLVRSVVCSRVVRSVQFSRLVRSVTFSHIMHSGHVVFSLTLALHFSFVYISM